MRIFLFIVVAFSIACVTPEQQIQRDKLRLKEVQQECDAAKGRLRTSVHSWFAHGLLWETRVPIGCDLL